MNDQLKPILLMAAAFVAGFGPAYYANPLPDAWPGWIVAGVVSVGVWIQAYWTTNPSLQPTTPAQLLASLKRSELPAATKAKVAPILAAETAKPDKEPQP